jgi:hypothetical protein
VALVVAGGGALVVEQHRAGPGDPAPDTVDSYFVGTRDLRRGRRLPPGTAAVTARVRIPAGVPGPGQVRQVTLTCPDGMRTAQRLQVGGSESFPRVLTGRAPSGPGGELGERAVTERYPSVRLERPVTFSVGVLCRRPDRDGSLVHDPRPTRPGETPMVTTAGSHEVHYRAGGVMTGTLQGHEPVSVLHVTPGGTWAKIASDNRQIRGWILTKDLRPR